MRTTRSLQSGAVAAVLAVFLAASVGGQGPDPAARLLAEARGKVAAGDREGAIRDLEGLVAGDGAVTVDARLTLAWLLLEDGDGERAAALAEEIEALAPRNPAAAGAQVVLGEVAMAAVEGVDELDAAATAFGRAWDLFPRSEFPHLAWRAEGRIREGEIRLRLGDVAAAKAAFLDVIEGEPFSEAVPRAYLGLATARAASGEPLSAVEALREGMARVASADGEASEAVAALRRRLAAADRLLLRSETESPWSAAVSVAGVAFRRPVAVSTRGSEAVIVDRGLDAVLWLHADGAVERREWRGAGRPFWDSSGRSWVGVRNTLQRPGASPASIRFATGDYKSFAGGAPAAVGAWVLTEKPDGLIRVSPEIHEADTVRLPPRAEIVDVASDLLGRPVVVDRKAGTLARASGQVFETLATGLDRPQAVDVGPYGHLYVLERNGRIAVFGPAGERVANLGPSLPGGLVLQGAEDLAVDEEGRLWIADAKASNVVRVE